MGRFYAWRCLVCTVPDCYHPACKGTSPRPHPVRSIHSRVSPKVEEFFLPGSRPPGTIETPPKPEFVARELSSSNPARSPPLPGPDPRIFHPPPPTAGSQPPAVSGPPPSGGVWPSFSSGGLSDRECHQHITASRPRYPLPPTTSRSHPA